VPTITVDQLHAWRLSRHSLLERAARPQWLDVVTRLGGLHAQVMSAGELIAGARVDGLSPEDIRAALWQERTLVKTWAMRGTLHLLPAREYGLYVAALRTKANYRNEAWRKYLGLRAVDEVDAIIEAVRVALDGRCLTREQLADAVAAQQGLPPHVREILLSGWGSLLKPAAYHGYLCFGPSQGQAVTFVRPDQWLGEPWPEMDSTAALREIIRRFLATYGPATRDDFALWWGVPPRHIRATFNDLTGELEPVEVGGVKAWALPGTAAQIAALAAPSTVRLLPMFDPFVFAAQSHRRFFYDPPFKDRIYRTAGWISAVVLVDGCIAGVWEYAKGRAGLTVQATLFAPPAAATRAGIEAEAGRLGEFLGLPLATVPITTLEETS
jgi:uncharacterized protein YcaQ